MSPQTTLVLLCGAAALIGSGLTMVAAGGNNATRLVGFAVSWPAAFGLGILFARVLP